MVLKKKKVIKALSKALVGTKKACKGTSKFIKTHGPGINRGLGRVAESISEGMAIRQQPYPRQRRDDLYLEIMPSGRKRFVKRKRPRQDRINWEGLGMRF
jgi:hypothetical protein